MSLNGIKAEDLTRGCDIVYGKVHNMEQGILTLVKKKGREIGVLDIETFLDYGMISGVKSMSDYAFVDPDSSDFVDYKNTLEGTF